jgi:hypothetical protein
LCEGQVPKCYYEGEHYTQDPWHGANPDLSRLEYMWMVQEKRVEGEWW